MQHLLISRKYTLTHWQKKRKSESEFRLHYSSYIDFQNITMHENLYFETIKLRKKMGNVYIMSFVFITIHFYSNLYF